MKFIAIIPARYASTRFPGKPLAVLGGKTVIQRVYEQAVKAVSEAYVATDDERIFQAVTDFGGCAVMTRTDHKSGTDRIQEAVEKIYTQHSALNTQHSTLNTQHSTLNTQHSTLNPQLPDVIINIQGDEPFVQPSQLEALKQLFENPDTQIGTLGKRFETAEAAKNPNSPKIVTDLRGFALYFSRSVIPYVRSAQSGDWFSQFPYLKHLGLYAYRREVLKEITQLPQSPLELAESLEQLRWLENGYRIRVGLTDVETVGIDTPEDLQRAEQFLQGQSHP